MGKFNIYGAYDCDCGICTFCNGGPAPLTEVTITLQDALLIKSVLCDEVCEKRFPIDVYQRFLIAIRSYVDL